MIVNTLNKETYVIFFPKFIAAKYLLVVFTKVNSR